MQVIIQFKVNVANYDYYYYSTFLVFKLPKAYKLPQSSIPALECLI